MPEIGHLHGGLPVVVAVVVACMDSLLARQGRPGWPVDPGRLPGLGQETSQRRTAGQAGRGLKTQI